MAASLAVADETQKRNDLLCPTSEKNWLTRSNWMNLNERIIQKRQVFFFYFKK